MGQYFKIVNLTKKYYINYGNFGENVKFSGIGRGLHSIILCRLLTSVSGQDSTLSSNQNQLLSLGSWIGDTVVVCGDEDDIGKFSINDDNLYSAVELDDGFIDITYESFSWIACDKTIFETFIQNGSIKEAFVPFIYYSIFSLKNGILERYMLAYFGKDWIKKLTM